MGGNMDRVNYPLMRYFSDESFKGSCGEIPYRLHLPSDNDPIPLLVFLHGMGAMGDDNLKQLGEIPPVLLNARQSFPMAIAAPQCPADDAWVLFPHYPESTRSTEEPTHSATLALEMIDHLIGTYNVDPQRIYIMGISLGGEGAYDMVSRRPGFFAGAVSLCGVFDLTRRDAVKDTAFWFFHGEKDDVNPVDQSREAYKILKKISPRDIRYTEYKGVKHNVWDFAFEEEELLPWLDKQVKSRE